MLRAHCLFRAADTLFGPTSRFPRQFPVGPNLGQRGSWRGRMPEREISEFREIASRLTKFAHAAKILGVNNTVAAKWVNTSGRRKFQSLGKRLRAMLVHTQPWAASQRSASRAAMQPVPAAVTAWR